MDRETITTIVAVLALILSVYNAIKEYFASRASLNVAPFFYDELDKASLAGQWHKGPLRALGISILNSGGAPLTIEEVGFTDGKLGAVVIQPVTKDSGSFPRTLAKREKLRVYLSEADLESFRISESWRAYAKTSCGIKALAGERSSKEVADYFAKLRALKREG